VTTVARADSAARQDLPAADAELLGGLDEAFLERLYRTTALVGVIVAALVAGRLGWRVGAGFLMGAALGLGSLRSLEWLVRRMTRPGASARKFTAAALLKIPAMGLAVGLVVWLAGGELPVLVAVGAGVALLPAVIVLKLLGRWLAGPKEESRG
jgi:hypothetical protein